jgi:hypothetical protein
MDPHGAKALPELLNDGIWHACETWERRG